MTETLISFSNVAILTGVILSGVGGFGAYYFGKKLEKEKDKETEVSERELKGTIDQLSNDARALKEQMKPFEQIAKTLYPNMQLEAAMAKLQEDVVTYQKRTRDLELKVAPRRINAATQEYLSKELGKIGGVRVQIDSLSSDSEATVYAKDMINVFRAAGWSVEHSSVMGPGHMVGVAIFTSQEMPALGIRQAVDLMGSRGIEFSRASIDVGLPSDTLRILVGNKGD
jgi:hypothetical protein